MGQQKYVSRAMTVMCKLELREEEEVRVRRFADDASDLAAARASFIVKLATVLKQIVETSVPQESQPKDIMFHPFTNNLQDCRIR